ncbi:peptidylprolyl isomerase [Candidatus Laterigemmans baculatus]|uniref:peptidylprolyl isomerase n=1 Tax=Candidatus Laterigemmans baculatus TaxID=2770505 RepID=UPI0013DC811E|nr:peptidylprolyl isomerase [Candidatus Laterigemmans baculatus]
MRHINLQLFLRAAASRVAGSLAVGALAALPLTLSPAASARAQESAGAQESARAPEAGAEAAAEPTLDVEVEQAAYRDAIGAWRETIGKMQEAALRFHNGTEATEEQYLTQYRELSEQGREEFDRAVRAATRLLAHDPRRDSEYAEFLFAAARYRFDRDWYELTGEAAEALIAAGMTESAEERRLHEIAGVSFWATNRFERAAEHLQKAIEIGFIDPKHRQLVDSVSDYQQRWEREQQFRQEARQRDDLPQVRITTSRGDMVVELFEDQAPNTVANFISLVEQGFYEGLTFHQVIASQIAMSGDPAGDASGSAGYRIADEGEDEDARDTFRGSLVMAKIADPRSRTGQTLPNSASSQFFFTFMPLPWVNREHTVFGRVIDGAGTLAALTRVDPTAKKEEEEHEAVPDRILRMEVLRKRPHDYQPEVLEGPPAAAISAAPGR